MGVLIDASVLIAIERGALDPGPYIAARPDELMFLSVITASEMLHGVYRARDAAQRARRSAFVEALLDRFALLDIDLDTARAHARLWAELRVAGTIIGQHDLWIGAAGVAHGLAVVTDSVREFARVPGLTVEVWGELP